MTVVNADQIAVWDGREGEHWALHSERYERANRRLVEHLITAELIHRDDAVLDIGCGAGKSTRDAARLATAGSVLGVDLSSQMLAHAEERSRAEGVANVSFVQADAQVHPFVEYAFDVAVSSYGAMFFSDPVAAFSNIGHALRPDGKLALLAWREFARNEWLSALRAALALGRQIPEPPSDAPTLVALADRERVQGILEASGYDHVEFEPIDDPVDFGADADDALTFLQTLGFVEGMTRDLTDDQRVQALAELRKTVEAHAGEDGVLFDSSSWLITAHRR